MSEPVTDECLIEKLMAVIMDHSAAPGGMNMNLHEVADALVANLSWTLSFSPDLVTPRDFRQAGEFWGKQLAQGISSAKEFNRENGLLASVELGRIQ